MTPTAYRLTVSRGAKAGLSRLYPINSPDQRSKVRTSAQRFADRLDAEYGAICAHVAAVYGA